MEASKFFADGDPGSSEGSSCTPDVVALVEQIDGAEPIYHFFVDGRSIYDVGATREVSDSGLVTYNFFNDYQQFAAVDLFKDREGMYVDWFGPEGDHRPQNYLDILPNLIDAAVYADFGVATIYDTYPLH